jgi:CNT family concentrative nucleoside transporter
LKENGVNFSYCLNKARAIVEPVVAVATTTKHEGDPFYIRFLRGLLGIAVVFMIAFFFSENKMAISWKVVGIGLGMQVTLAFLILNPLDIWALDFFSKFFDGLGKTFVKILDFSKEGTKFLFSSFLDIEKHGFLFAFQVLPTIIFFSALTSVLFYLGIIQKIVYVFAIALTKALKLSGAESLSVAGNIFLGQTESPLMIKAYLEKMSRSEILLVMTGGMATLAGGVLAAYIAFLGGDDPVERLTYAKHLLAASFMAAPGAVIISKIIVPQSEKIESDVEITKEKIGSNVLDSISNGTVEGLKLAVNVASMLLVFIAFIAMFNFMLVKVGSMTGLNSWITDISNAQYNEFSLQFILGYVFAPLMWVLGVCTEDMTLVGRLIGEKVIMTEFIGYISLKDLKEAGAFTETKSIIMATYMLCGFANFASIGIQIGGIGSLAPGKRKLLSEFGLKALLAGTLASLLSATIIGMILG